MNKHYPGLHNDDNGGLTPLGKVIMDAWVFDLLPEEEDCANWDLGRLQPLYDQVHAAWEGYGHLPSKLPKELQQRHRRIYDAARERARAVGWDPEREFND
ncbi:MAG: hypothetical protein H7842_10025 [Gammaproteobacteria bacterium SHHR-1]|uniref:hypothetical protein n=1 Tax=Magnetovirga frankeli TaxID=947516 RepID=UPI001292D2DA|nr:hypothetical protein D5125_02985 [gamma proteobacterium SS-5]